MSYPGLRVVFPTVFLFWGGFAFFQTFFQVMLIQKLHFSANNIGDFFAYIGIWIALTQAVFTPLIAKRLRPDQVVRFSVMGSGITLFMYLLATNTTHLLWITPVFAFFLGNSIANLTALVSISADQKIQGQVLGINASVQSLAQFIPAAMSGYLAEIGVSVPVLAGGITVLVGGALFFIIYRVPAHMLHENMEMPATASH
jgi:DHA1 family tetracycline resistance protein-like MFS transporter